MTAQADVFSSNPISSAVRLSSYYHSAERIFAKGMESRERKEWKMTYIMMKRYVMLTARELRKHNAFGAPTYAPDRAKAKRFAERAFDVIVEATKHLKEELRSKNDEVVLRMKDLNVEKVPRDTPKPETSTTGYAVDVVPAPRPLSAEERVALDRLRIPSGPSNSASTRTTLSTSTGGLSSIVKIRYKSPYQDLLRGLRGHEGDHAKPPSYPGIVGDATSRERVDVSPSKATGGVNAQDRAFRQSLLRSRGMRIVDCRMDGNCLFRAVSHQMYGTQERHGMIRKNVCDYMRTQKDRFKWLVDPPTAEAFERYVRARERPVQEGVGEWGDHAEIIVLEELFDRTIEIYAPSSGVLKPRKTHMDGELPEELKDVTPIRLHYQGNNHYNSIVSSRTDGRQEETVPLRRRDTRILQQFRSMTMAMS